MTKEKDSFPSGGEKIMIALALGMLVCVTSILIATSGETGLGPKQITFSSKKELVAKKDDKAILEAELIKSYVGVWKKIDPPSYYVEHISISQLDASKASRVKGVVPLKRGGDAFLILPIVAKDGHKSFLGGVYLVNSDHALILITGQSYYSKQDILAFIELKKGYRLIQLGADNAYSPTFSDLIRSLPSSDRKPVKWLTYERVRQ